MAAAKRLPRAVLTQAKKAVQPSQSKPAAAAPERTSKRKILAALRKLHPMD